MQNYEHKQVSPWPLAALAFTALICACFSALRTRVDEHGVSWEFGLGFPRGSLRFDDIEAVALTKTTLAEGYGIHLTRRHGWLWNAAGRDAVTIRKRDGGAITLGSDDAFGLYEAIRSRLRPWQVLPLRTQ